MSQADAQIIEIQDVKVSTISGAIYLSMHDAKGWTEIIDSKNKFLCLKLIYPDDSWLWINRSGKITSYVKGKLQQNFNIYTYSEKAQ